MSVTDPLIKDIKGHTRLLFEESLSTKKITDSSNNLRNLCISLEKIFHQGLIQNQNVLLSKKNNEPYNWMRAVRTEDFNYTNSVERVRNCKNVHSSLGRFRLLIRCCLMKNCLHLPIELLSKSNKTKDFYERNSIIGDEILSAILLSVLLQCDKINFQLELCNSYFLDFTWEIPEMVRLELVPCKNLGLSVSFSENRAAVVNVAPNSVASESGEISGGDILANLNGVDINSSCKGRLNTILRLSKGRPIQLILIKALRKQEIFAPIKHIMQNLKIDSKSENDGVAVQKAKAPGYRGVYLGCVNVGSKGNVKQIEDAIRRCLKLSKEKRPISFEIGEINVKILDSETCQVIFKHPYMQISSCGSAFGLPNYVAYIVGNEPSCEAASTFVCHVFHVKNVEDACQILQSIGQGFYRTHFAV